MSVFLHGDCLDEMMKLPKGSVDLVLTDPPYGTTQCKWDAVIPFEPMWKQLKHVTKLNAAIVMTASHPFTSALVMSNPKMFRYELVWHKNKASGHLNAKKMPMRAHENIVVFYRKLPTYNPQKTVGHKAANYAKNKANSRVYGAQVRSEYGGATERYPRSVIDVPVVNNDGTNGGRLHPNQKPVELMEYLIKTYTNEGDIVLDFTMGSGTTGVACKNLGRNFIGIEKDAGFYDIAVKRVADVVRSEDD